MIPKFSNCYDSSIYSLNKKLSVRMEAWGYIMPTLGVFYGGSVLASQAMLVGEFPLFYQRITDLAKKPLTVEPKDLDSQATLCGIALR